MFTDRPDDFEGTYHFIGTVEIRLERHSLEAIARVYDGPDGQVVYFDCLPHREFWLFWVEGQWKNIGGS